MAHLLGMLIFWGCSSGGFILNLLGRLTTTYSRFKITPLNLTHPSICFQLMGAVHMIGHALVCLGRTEEAEALRLTPHGWGEPGVAEAIGAVEAVGYQQQPAAIESGAANLEGNQQQPAALEGGCATDPGPLAAGHTVTHPPSRGSGDGAVYGVGICLTGSSSPPPPPLLPPRQSPVPPLPSSPPPEHLRALLLFLRQSALCRRYRQCGVDSAKEEADNEAPDSANPGSDLERIRHRCGLQADVCASGYAFWSHIIRCPFQFRFHVSNNRSPALASAASEAPGSAPGSRSATDPGSDLCGFPGCSGDLKRLLLHHQLCKVSEG